MSAILRLFVRSFLLRKALICPAKDRCSKNGRASKPMSAHYHVSRAFSGATHPIVQFYAAGLLAWEGQKLFRAYRQYGSGSLASRGRRSITTSAVRRSNTILVESGEDFSERVLNAKVPVLVDFYADWCGPCRNLGPRLEAKVGGQDGRVLLAKIDVDSVGGGLVDEFQISAIPTVIAFKDGEIFGRFEGDVEDAEIDNLLEDITAE